MEVSDILTILKIGGSVLMVAIGWIIKIEIQQTKMDSRIDANTEKDNDRAGRIDKFMDQYKLDMDYVKGELSSIHSYINAEKAVKKAKEKGE